MFENLRSDHSAGRHKGVYSVCSAHSGVLKAAMAEAVFTEDDMLIEATPNQVNPFGGYTGMRPAQFRSYLLELASAAGLSPRRLRLGADHLGPYVWRNETAQAALAKAEQLARECIAAGFTKIHLDPNPPCADDPPSGLSPETVAGRTAFLCRAAEAAADHLPDSMPRPVYVIGTEVPAPGGDLEQVDRLAVSRPEDVAETIELTRDRFRSAGLEAAWRRVIAVVVQPGVEFGDTEVAVYRPDRARPLSAFHENLPGGMTFEIHSTDFQPPDALHRLVRDHFTLLKVGPCLSFAFREAVFALAHIESEWLTGRKGFQPSNIRTTLERVMLENPAHWQSHYTGSPGEQRRMRAFSYRDRIRYYWRHPAVSSALTRLCTNLSRPVPHSLIRQYFPDLYPGIEAGFYEADPASLIRRRIQTALAPYGEACRNSSTS
ncbi:MAG: class II D-tagatose-bisphosphate aldolase non-catalytic subunit [Desulfococcaceae bacterium]